MKHAWILLLLILPLACAAQNFEIGANGGLSFHSLPIGNSYADQDKPKLSYALSVKADLIIVNTQIGIGGEMVNLTQYNYLQPTYTTKVYNNLAKPLLTPYIFLNRIHDFIGGYIYGGLMVGAAAAKVGVNTLDYINGNGAISGYSTTYNSVIGYVAGLQIGFTTLVSKTVAINAEAAMRYTNFDYKDPTSTIHDDVYHYRVFYFPMTVGVRFRI